MAEFELSTKVNGETVKMTVEYPDNKAILAINAVRHFGSEKNLTQLIVAFSNDESVREALDRLDGRDEE